MHNHGSFEMNNACPCCGYLTFEEETNGSYAICPVCYWEDDYIPDNDIYYAGGANGISLQDARMNFSRYKAIKQEFINQVRDPLINELP